MDSTQPYKVGWIIRYNKRFYVIEAWDELILPAIGYNSSDIAWKVGSSGTCDAGSSIDYHEVTELNPQTNQVIVLTGIGVEGRGKFKLSQPSTVTRWGTAKYQAGALTQDESPRGNEYPIEIHIANEQPPHIRYENDTTTLTVTPLIYPRGYIYRIGKYEGPTPPPNFTDFTIGGVQSVG